MQLSADQREELEAIKLTTGVLGMPTHLSKELRHDPVVGPLVDAGLITWGWPDPRTQFTRLMRAVELTPKGRALVE